MINIYLLFLCLKNPSLGFVCKITNNSFFFKAELYSICSEMYPQYIRDGNRYKRDIKS